jgi:lipopolysaccharide biosynthesis glycosyltransferase
MNIVFASDAGYAQHLAVSIASLLKNTKHDDIQIYIIDGGLSEKSKSKLNDLSSIQACTFHYLIPNSSIFTEAPINKSHTVGGKRLKSFSSSAYHRLLIPELLENENKAIYLDSDIVVNTDIAELWQQPFGEAAILAVETPVWPDFNENQLNKLTLTNKKPYFNSGVMLMNLKTLRKKLPTSKSIQIIENYGKNFLCHDQDVLNIGLKDDWGSLHPKFNVLPEMVDLKNRKFHYYSSKDIQDAVLKPVVIHFARRPKPWHYGCVDSRRKEYFTYLNYTQFYDYRIPEPSYKERIKYYKEYTGLFLDKILPKSLFQLTRNVWRYCSNQH